MLKKRSFTKNNNIQVMKYSRNINISLLKVFLVFLVICAHFGQNYFNRFTPYAVPCFMMISFYYLSKNYENCLKLGMRIIRILIPLLGWAIIYYLVYLIILNRNISIYDLLWQATTGHSPKLNASMWFSVDLLFLTILYFMYRKNIKSKFLIPGILLFLSYLYQYRGINAHLFTSLRFELKYPLGRLDEMLPFAIIGSSSYYFLPKKFFQNKIILIVGAICCFLVLKTFNLRVNFGFGYSGIDKLLGSFILIVIFLEIPFKKLPNSIKFILLKVSNFTLGIYCIHRLVEACCHSLIYKFQIQGTIYSCLLIYIISYLICYLISKIPIKAIKMLV